MGSGDLMGGPWEDYAVQAAPAAPVPAVAAPSGPWDDYRQLPDITDPSSPDYSRRHGGSFVTGLVDAIVPAATSAFTLPGDVATGKVDPTSQQGVERAADMALMFNPAPPARLTTNSLAGVAPKEAASAPVAASTRPLGPEVAEAGARIGVDIPRAVASDSRAVQAAGAGARNIPFAGEPLMQASEKALQQIGEAAKGTATSYSPATVAEAGGSLRDAISVGWKGRTSENLEKLYGKVDELVNPSVRTPLSATQGAVADILASRAAQRVNDPGKAASFVTDAISDKAGLTYDGVKGLRSRVGEMLKNPNALASADISQQELKSIYKGLSSDLRESVRASGGDAAVARFEAANGYNRSVATRRENLDRLVGAKSDEQLFDRLLGAASSRGRADISLLSQARKAAGPEAWDDVAGATVSRLGRDPQGNFSPDRFITDFGKLSAEGKALLFGSTGRSDLARSLTDIATVSSRFKELQKYANPSGTARNTGFAAMGAGLMTNPVTMLGGLLGGNVLARVLAQPATASSAAKWATAYERVAKVPSAATLASLNSASRNLANSVAAKAGAAVEATAFARAVNDNLLLGGMRSSRAADQDEQKRP